MENIKQFIPGFKAAGFDVYGPSHLTSYVWLHKDGKIGYCQIDRFSGLTFSTCHMPNPITGTGFKLDNGSPETAVNTFAPVWTLSLSSGVKKWQSLKQFLNAHKWANPIQY